MYKLINIGTQANSQIREYIADAEDDIATLPDSDPFGSTVFVIETSATYMKNSAGEYVEIVVSSGGGNAPLEAEGTLVTDEQTGKMTITLNKTAGELYEAACAGKQLKLSMQITMEDDESGTDYVVDITKIMAFTAARIVAESFGAVGYNFEARIGSDDGDKLLYSGDLAENDTVVLMEV